MNSIIQISIFDYIKVKKLGDLKRLKIFFDNTDDSNLCNKLGKLRKNGRNDYPITNNVKLDLCNENF